MNNKKIDLKYNAIMSGLNRCITAVFPLITFPYVSRILGAENIGKYDFSYSISQYCLILSMLGISNYAVREGVRVKDNKLKINTFASQLFSINLIMCCLVYIILGIFLFIAKKLQENIACILILSTSSLFTAVGVEWIYQIYEQYTYITLRNFVVKLLSLICIFVFVHCKEDYVTYAVINAISIALVGIYNFYKSRSFCKIQITKSLSLRSHIVSLLILASSSISTYIYASSDITMLGFFSNDYYVGIYSTVEKFYNLAKSVLLSILTVVIPRLSYYSGQNNSDKFDSLIKNIIGTMNMLVLPLIAIVFVLSDEIVMVLGGIEYIEASNTLKILSIAILFSMYAWISNACILIPKRLEIYSLFATVTGASVNIVLNVFLIPKYYANAAAVTTLIAELCVAVICTLKAKKVSKFKFLNRDVITEIVGMAIILIISFGMKSIHIHFVLRFGIISIICLLVYLSVLFILHNSLLYSWIKLIFQKLHK